ncbi:short transient receptor potential channel 1-like, partial [Convolutriloba macropyga]|uniref:short transient receptor potential channel 1-like n=1 Tax=Convolutriloba macropyga TaxID=536237 RepID=UPI003F5248CF
MHSHTTAQSGRRRDPDDDDESSDESSGGSSYLSSIEKMKKNNYGHFLEMKFMRAVHDNDYFMVESMLWKQKHEVHVDSLDEVGHTSLAVACLSNSSEMMAVLLKYGCRIREELLVCIDQDFREGAVTLLDRLYNLQGSICVNQPPVEKLELFPAGATAVKVASVSNNLDMLKLLRRYGSEPIPMPEQEVTAKNSTEVYYTMKALASPAYCLVMAKRDPMMMAFKVSTHCRSLAEKNPHQSEQYEELSNKMEAFAHQWFGSASDNYEVNMIIGLPDQINMEVGLSYDILMGTKTNSFLPNANPGILNSSKYCRLRYALLHNHVSFVSHPYCQQAVMKDFEACLPSGWRDKPTAFKVCVIFALTMLTPIWIGLYWLLPDKEYPMKKFGGLIHWPYMKVMTNLLLYAIIQVALILSKNKWDMVSFDPGEPGATRERLLASTGNTNSRYIPNVDFLSIYICIWTV